MQLTKYINSVLITAVMTIFLFQLPSVIVDPYKVFGFTDFNQKNFEPNTRYLKIEHLLKDTSYNAFILGSSRVNFYDIELANKLLGYKFYNMTAPSETQPGVRKKLDWLVTNRKIKKVIIGLDYDHQTIETSSDLLRLDHPLVSGQSQREFYFKYTLFQPNSLITAIQDNFKSEKEYLFDLNKGQYVFPMRDTLRKENPDLYAANSLKPRLQEIEKKGKNPIETARKNNSLKELQKTVDIINKNNIDATFVINPYNHHLFVTFDINEYNEWLSKVVEITGQVWDFAGINSVTINDKMYYEYSHFNKEVGDLVLTKMFNSKNKDLGLNIPSDFGVFVTSKNLNDHLETTKRTYEKYKEDYKKKYMLDQAK